MTKIYLSIAALLLAVLACSPVEETAVPTLPAPTAAGLTEYVVTADTLYIRQYPSLNAPEAGVLTRGKTVHCFIAEMNDGVLWCNIGNGWASTVYLEEK